MIAGAFPGLFTFVDLLNLDVRDFEFWSREAQRKVLNEKIEALRLSRMAWAETEFVRDELAMYQAALAELDGTKPQRIEAAWEELKHQGKG